MSNLVQKARSKIRRFIFSLIARSWQRRDRSNKLVRLGSDYGGWWCPERCIGAGKVAVCAGAGEDITFDIALLSAGCRVVTVDPTPRAKIHVENALRALRGEMTDHTDGIDYRRIYGTTVPTSNFSYYPVGLWSKCETIRFYAPRVEEHVSYSAVNLQGTAQYFEASCLTLTEIMRTGNLNVVDLIKMDVEGAEYSVIESILSGDIRPRAILVEFDEGYQAKEWSSIVRINKCRRALRDAGYRLTKVSDWNFTFVFIGGSVRT